MASAEHGGAAGGAGVLDVDDRDAGLAEDVGDPMAGAGARVHVGTQQQVDVPPGQLGVGQRLEQRLGAHRDRRLAFEPAERVHAHTLDHDRLAHQAPPTR